MFLSIDELHACNSNHALLVFNCKCRPMVSYGYFPCSDNDADLTRHVQLRARSTHPVLAKPLCFAIGTAIGLQKFCPKEVYQYSRPQRKQIVECFSARRTLAAPNSAIRSAVQDLTPLISPYTWRAILPRLTYCAPAVHT